MQLRYGIREREMLESNLYLLDLESKFKKINPKEYYLSYSGGKDSHLLYWFIKEWLHDTDIEIVSLDVLMVLGKKKHSQN